MRPFLSAALSVALALPAAPGLSQDADEGAGLFGTYCASCHGATAEGDGPMTEILVDAPPDLTGLAAGNGGVFPVARVVFRIDGRDPLLAHGGPMPVYGDIFEQSMAPLKAETGQPILAGQGIADLVAYLKTLQR